MSPSTQEYLDRLQASSPRDVVKIVGSMQRGDEYKYVTVDFSTKKFPDSIELVHLTDVQFGHKCCNVTRFIEFRDWVLKEPNRFVFLGGDMVDAAHALSVGSPFENTDEPQSQVFRFVELAIPMRHRIIGSVGGNHERRSVKTYGDLGHLIATLLRIPYSSGKQFVDIHYGKHKPFRNSLWHGSGGARTKGAKMQMLHRFMCQGTADCYWVGHLHDVLTTFDWRERRDGGDVQLEKFCGVMSSSFLDFWGTYAEVAGLSPTDTMMGHVILEPNGKWRLSLR